MVCGNRITRSLVISALKKVLYLYWISSTGLNTSTGETRFSSRIRLLLWSKYMNCYIISYAMSVMNYDVYQYYVHFPNFHLPCSMYD